MTPVAYVNGVWAQFNVANALTFLRVVLVVPVMWFAYEGQYVFVLLTVLLAAATDYLDGVVARKRGLGTPLGRVADPLADKVFIDLALLPAVFIHEEPMLLYLWTITFFYDADNTWQRRREIGRALLNLPNDKPDLPASSLSKAKTAVLFIFTAYCYLPVTVLDPELLWFMAAVSLGLVGASWFNNRRKSFL